MATFSANPLEAREVAKTTIGDGAEEGTSKEMHAGRGRLSVSAPGVVSGAERDIYEDTPTDEEMKTLRRVSGKIPWTAWTIAFVELCERFSYYGTTIVYVNFIQQPRPDGSRSGAGGADGQSGALGRGQQASTGLTLFNSFWAYVTPLFGAYVADAYLGRFKTIHIAIMFALVGHIVLTASAAPSVLDNPNSAMGAFIIGLFLLGCGTGFFKSNISPLLAEQVIDTRMRVKTLEKTGERVIIDPAVTNTRIFLYFYLMINVGSLTGQIAMVYAEKFVGFWLSYLIPTAMFLIAPIVLAVCKKHYRLSAPTGSVFSTFLHMFGMAMKGHWFSWKGFTWDVVRPSNIAPASRPKWMTYDDAWVDEVRRGLNACKVFTFLPIFFLAYNQMTNNLTSQAATMELNGAPNDLIQNLNPITIIVTIPLLDHVVYPGFRKMGFVFTPIKRMTCGFLIASFAMIAACVTQVYIYRLAPCGTNASDSDCIDANGPAPFSAWIQFVSYALIGVAEIFTNVTSLEYAYSKAPNNMKSLVMSVNLFMSAISSAIGQALVPLSSDPLLVWNYGAVAVVAGVAAPIFWFLFRNLDKEEDAWNSLAKSSYHGRAIEPSAEKGESEGSVSQEKN